MRASTHTKQHTKAPRASMLQPSVLCQESITVALRVPSCSARETIAWECVAAAFSHLPPSTIKQQVRERSPVLSG